MDADLEVTPTAVKIMNKSGFTLYRLTMWGGAILSLGVVVWVSRIQVDAARSERDMARSEYETKSEEAANLKQQFDELQTKSTQLEIERNQYAAALKDIQIKLEDVLPKLRQTKQWLESQVALDQAKEAVEKLRASHEASPSAQPIFVEAEPEAWIPPMQHVAESNAKAKAMKEYPNDYSMVEHEVKEQMEALTQLINLSRYPENRELLASAHKKWKDDFHMMLYEFKRQATAKANLESR